jgi:hypothetical protein
MTKEETLLEIFARAAKIHGSGLSDQDFRDLKTVIIPRMIAAMEELGIEFTEVTALAVITKGDNKNVQKSKPGGSNRRRKPKTQGANP